eukprot:gene2910-3344_t
MTNCVALSIDSFDVDRFYTIHQSQSRISNTFQSVTVISFTQRDEISSTDTLYTYYLTANPSNDEKFFESFVVKSYELINTSSEDEEEDPSEDGRWILVTGIPNQLPSFIWLTSSMEVEANSIVLPIKLLTTDFTRSFLQNLH